MNKLTETCGAAHISHNVTTQHSCHLVPKRLTRLSKIKFVCQEKTNSSDTKLDLNSYQNPESKTCLLKDNLSIFT